MRSIADILDRVLAICRGDARTLAAISLVIGIPAAAVTCALIDPAVTAALGLLEGDVTAEQVRRLAVLVFLAVLVSGTLDLVRTLALLAAYDRASAGQPLSVRGAIGTALRRIVDASVLVTLTGSALALLVGATTVLILLAVALDIDLLAVAAVLGCLAAAFRLSMHWLLAVPVCVVERAGALRSLACSTALVRRRFWGVAGRVLVLMLVTGIAGALAQQVAAAVVEAGLGTASAGDGVDRLRIGLRTAVLSSALAQTLMAPLQQGAYVELYRDLVGPPADPDRTTGA